MTTIKTAERDEARRLRREQGESIKAIARMLGVSRSSVSRWVAGIELTPEQHLALQLRNPIHNAQVNGAQVRSRRARELRLRAQQEGRWAARLGDPVHASACMLYWAEGTKHRNVVQLTSSEPPMIRFFLDFLRRWFGVTDDLVRIQCNLHSELDEQTRTVETYWLGALALPRTCLTKSIVN